MFLGLASFNWVASTWLRLISYKNSSRVSKAFYVENWILRHVIKVIVDWADSTRQRETIFQFFFSILSKEVGCSPFWILSQFSVFKCRADALDLRNSSWFFCEVPTIRIHMIKKELGVYRRVPEKLQEVESRYLWSFSGVKSAMFF